MPSEPLLFTLTLPSDLRHLPIARLFVEGVCQAEGFDKPVTDAVVLAANEATSNVIRHAHRDCPGSPLRIQCRLLSDGIEVCLFDEGPSFDLDAVPRLDPSEVRVGGRGVFLMRSLMDEVSIQPRQERGNVLRMVKRGARNSLQPAPT
jgi:serine/threonine-protein kinase RsbW